MTHDDATMTTTMLDRLMHRCAMLDFEGKSLGLPVEGV